MYIIHNYIYIDALLLHRVVPKKLEAGSSSSTEHEPLTTWDFPTGSKHQFHRYRHFHPRGCFPKWGYPTMDGGTLMLGNLHIHVLFAPIINT